MGKPRFIPIALTADERPAVASIGRIAKAFDPIAARTKRLMTEMQGGLVDIERRAQKIFGGMGGGARGGSSRMMDAHVRAFRQMEKEAARSAREVQRIEAQTARQAEAQERIRERAARQLSQVQVREAKSAANDMLKLLRDQTRVEQQLKREQERLSQQAARTAQQTSRATARFEQQLTRETLRATDRAERERTKQLQLTGRAYATVEREKLRAAQLTAREEMKLAQQTARAQEAAYKEAQRPSAGSGGRGGMGIGSIVGGVFGGNILTSVLSSAYSGIKGGVQSGFDYNRLKENLIFGYRRKLGSQDEAEKFFSSISQFATEESPLQIPQAQEQANRLLALRFKPGEVIPLLRSAGDTAAGLGKVGTEAQEKIEQITLALGQMKLKQKVSAEEMTRQLVEAGVDSWGYVAESLQKQYPQYARLTREQAVATAQDLAEHNRLNADTVVSIIVKGMQRDFGGLGKTINLETVAGKESNVEDRFRMLSGTATGSAFGKYGQGLDKLLALLQSGAAEKLAGGISATTGGLFEGMESTLKAVASGDIQKLGLDAVSSVANGARQGAQSLYDAGAHAAGQLEQGWRDKLVQHSPSQVMLKLGYEAGLSLVTGFRQGAKGQQLTDQIEKIIEEAAATFGLDPNLIRAMMRQESGGKRGAVSPKGASGLMQLMPGTAKRYGVTNIFDPEQNIMGGAHYMADLLKMFGGDPRLALAGYNAGEGAVRKYGNQIPPYKETQTYVQSIMKGWTRLSTGVDGPVSVQVQNLPPLQDWLSQFKGSGYKPDVALGHTVPDKPASGDLRGGVGVFRDQINPRGFAEWLYFKEKSRPIGGNTSPMEQADWQRTLSVMAEEMNVSRAGMQIIQGMVAQRLELEKQSLAMLSAQGAANGGSFKPSSQFANITDEQARRALEIATRSTGELKQEVGTLAQTVTPQALQSLKYVAQETAGAFGQITPLVKESTEAAEKHAKQISGVLSNYFGAAVKAGIRGQWQALFSGLVGDVEDFLIRLGKERVQERLLKLLSPGQGGGAAGAATGALQSVATGGSRPGGFIGGLKSLFGFGSSAAGAGSAGGAAAASALPMGTIAPGALSAAALASWGAGGAAGLGIGAAAGSSAAATGGVFTGSLFGGAGGAGAGAGAGGASGGMLALMTNPWTIGIAAAAIGGFALWKHFSNRTEKALRKTIKSEYAVDVKEMATLKEVKAIGESVYGKGQVSKHLLETVRLEQVKDLLSSYAERTNQTASSLITNKEFADLADPRNNFTARMFGGPVVPGMPYIVGERRPELFVPTVSGRIEPHVNDDVMQNLAERMPLAVMRRRMLERMRAQAASSSEASMPDGGGGAQRRGAASQALTAAMVSAVQQSNQLLGALDAKLRSMSPTDVLRVAAEAAPEIIGNANAEALKGASVRGKTQDALGMRK